LADASKRRLEEEVNTHRNLISEMYGEQAVGAFAEVAGLDAIFVLDSYEAQKNARLEANLEDEKARNLKLRVMARTAINDREELQKLRALAAAKKADNRRKKGKLESKRAGEKRRK